MNKIESLNADLDRQKAEDMELAKQNFADSDELTDKDLESLERIKRDHAVVIAETDEVGRKETPVEEYTSSIESRVTRLTNKLGEDTTLRMVNSGDIKKTTEELKADARSRVIGAMKSLSYDQSLSDDDYMEINNQAIDAMMKHFNMKTVDADRLAAKMANMGARQIAAILPKRFVDIYCGEDEITNKNASKVKDRLIAAIAYVAVTGPEMDYLNEYIDHENHLVEVGQRLIKCQIELTEALKSEETIAAILKRSRVQLKDYDVWSKYIKQPAFIMNQFAQRAVTHEMLADAYSKLLEEYTDDDAVARINQEIKESHTKADMYRTVTKLEMFKYLLKVYMERLATDKRRSMKLLEKDALDAVDRVKRCKINLAFPGYTGKEYNNQQILDAAKNAISKSITNFINTLDEVRKKVNDDLTVPEYKVDPNKCALVLIIIMGRLVKNLTKGSNLDKYNAIMLDAYFQLFCGFGGDVYIMDDILTEIYKYDVIESI